MASPPPHEYGTHDLTKRPTDGDSGSTAARQDGPRSARRHRRPLGSLGWERSPLGYPTSIEYTVTGGRAASFAHGTITWTATATATATAATGATTVRYQQPPPVHPNRVLL